MDSANALLQPVRLRVVQALLASGELTTHELHERLGDVPIATLYRQIARLLEHELIEVADEQQVRGATERTYRVAPGLANPSAEELESLSPDQLLAMFTVFVSGLISDFGAYLHDGAPELVRDRVSFAQASFWATADEVDEFLESFMPALLKLVANEPGKGRRRRTLTTVLVPRPESEAH